MQKCWATIKAHIVTPPDCEHRRQPATTLLLVTERAHVVSSEANNRNIVQQKWPHNRRHCRPKKYRVNAQSLYDV